MQPFKLLLKITEKVKKVILLCVCVGGLHQRKLVVYKQEKKPDHVKWVCLQSLILKNSHPEDERGKASRLPTLFSSLPATTGLMLQENQDTAPPPVIHIHLTSHHPECPCARQLQSPRQSQSWTRDGWRAGPQLATPDLRKQEMGDEKAFTKETWCWGESEASSQHNLLLEVSLCLHKHFSSFDTFHI